MAKPTPATYKEKIKLLKRYRDRKDACIFPSDRDIIVLQAILDDVEFAFEIHKNA